MKVIDPEFAFYGPIGYDLGNLIANLYFAWMYTVLSSAARTDGRNTDSVNNTEQLSPKADIPTEFSGAGDNAARIAAAIEALPQLFTAKAFARCRTAALSDPLYNERYIRQRLTDMVADAYGFAGTEMIRRTIGDTKTAEFDAMGTDKRRIAAERIVIKTACMLIKQRRKATIGERAAAYFKRGCRRLQFQGA